MPYLTPDAVQDIDAADRCIRVPSNYGPVVYGSILELTKPWNWEKHGPDDVEDATAKMIAMLEDWEKPCMPIGAILATALASAPEGYLDCDGGTHDEEDYPLLYAALDDAYILSPTQFTTPDLRGRVVVGSGAGVGLTVRDIDDTGGDETHTLVTAEMPAHTHTYLPPAINPDIEGPGIPDIGATVLGSVVATGSAGADGAHENMPPFTVLAYYIRAE